MAIEKINFSYPRGSLQGVHDVETMTALELASKTSKKVDECVEIVNMVEQTAIEATAIVDEMRINQEQFVTDNADIRSELVNQNQEFIDDLRTSSANFEINVQNDYATFKGDINTSRMNFETAVQNDYATYKGDLNTSRMVFEVDINALKDQFLGNATTAMHDNINDRLNYILTANVVGIMSDADKEFVRVTGETKLGAQQRVDTLSDSVDLKIDSVVKIYKGQSNPTQAQIDVMKDGDLFLVYGDVYLPTI